MEPARAPRYPRDEAKLMLGERTETVSNLPERLSPGDVMVLNDASTMPAALAAITGDGAPIELRLTGPPHRGRWRAVTFGAGDWRIDTHARPAPPVLRAGDRLRLGDERIVVTRIDHRHHRMVTLDLGPTERAWRRVFRHGRPVQYSHLREALPLWAAQTVYGGLPWAVELASAGRPLSWQLLAALRERGVTVVTLTHAAGLSATGDPALDAALPLPEPYRIPASTVDAIEGARRRGGRVLAVGTTVVRALEDAHRRHGRLVAGDGVATLRLDPGHHLRVVDGLLTGMHAPGESHYALMGAFAPPRVLAALHARAEREGLLAHEFGDLVLLWHQPRRGSFRGETSGAWPASRRWVATQPAKASTP